MRAVTLALAFVFACGGDHEHDWPYHVEEAFIQSCLDSGAKDLGLQTHVYCLCMTHEAKKLWAISDLTQTGVKFQRLIENGAHWVCQNRAKSAKFDLTR